MASEENPEKKKKKKKMHGRRKLLPGENVEVLFSDEGLKGSWHAGTVIGCSGCSRLIEYRDLSSEDESSKLKETVNVSVVIEGQTKKNPKNYRGLIRPLPPLYDIQISEIRYGLCVDALIDDAWWEGVVIDHDEGSTNRLIFFPDDGDQQMVAIDHLRLTQDWNEASNTWKPRGAWLLFQSLQPFQDEDVMPVSIREFWFHLTTIPRFTEKIGLWMFGSQPVWDNLVTELMQELLSVVHGLLGVSCDQSVDAPLTSGSDEIPTGVKDNGKRHGQNIQNQKSEIPRAFLCHEDAQRSKGLDPSYSAGQGSKRKGNSRSVIEGTKSKKCRDFSEWSDDSLDHLDSSRTKLHPISWNENLESAASESVRHHEHIHRECHPEAVVTYWKYIKSTRGKGNLKFSKLDIEGIRLNAKQHLLYMGWSLIERKRIRFASPEGEIFNSLYTACEEYLLKEEILSSRDSNVSQNF